MKRLFALMTLVIAPTVTAGDLGSVSWKTTHQKALNSTADLPKQTQAVLLRLLPNADLVTPNVGEAIFADLDGDSTLELVATVDYSGRDFYTNVVIIQNSGGRLSWSEIAGNGISVTDLPSHLVDADGDGALELTTDRYIDRYEGAERAPKETLVFRWKGNRYVEDSDAYPAYYRKHVIPQLEEKLKTLAGTPSTSATQVNDYEAFTIRAELDRAKRHGKVK